MTKLPPYGRSILAMLERHERPRGPDGTFVAALAWDIAPHWARIVIPDEPCQYSLGFARGLDWLVLSHDGHPSDHVDAVARALREAGARIVVPVTLP